MKTIEIDLAPTIGNLRFQKTLLCVKETLKIIMEKDEFFISFQKPNDIDYISVELQEIINLCLKTIICLEGNEEYREICNDLKDNIDNAYADASRTLSRSCFGQLADVRSDNLNKYRLDI